MDPETFVLATEGRVIGRMDAETFLLATDGGGYWPGLIVPAVILLVAALAGAVVFFVMGRGESAGSGGGDAGPDEDVRP